MKRILISAFCIPFLFNISFAQAPEIEWENTIGGNSSDYATSVAQTVDGGYILGGFSSSPISGDKTEAWLGYADYWVIKLYADGTIQWQNNIGGFAYDEFKNIEQTADGGYIVGGFSNSAIGGEKTEANIGSYDFWILKLDAAGTIVWQNTIGGNGDDQLSQFHQTTDGGYIIGGYSKSGISGDKSEATIGNYDYWIVKLNSSGTIVWQNTIGGGGIDRLYSIDETSDGGFILGGTSSSVISGDKTEPKIGENDYWVIKINSVGNIVWQNVIGGTMDDQLRAIEQTADGGYIVGGYSNSGISGDKTEPALDNEIPYTSDYWIIKLNSSGAITWQNTIGGYGDDIFNDIHQTSDGSYILGGHSNSRIGSDKIENGFFGGNLGYDYWVLKLNNNGNILWQNTIGGEDDDYFMSIDETVDDGYFMAGWSSSNASGDKLENVIGGGIYMDYWIVKLVPDNCIPQPYYVDSDDDDYGAGISPGLSCEPPGTLFSMNDLDCNDAFAIGYPGAEEFCDGFDDNCNGLIDEGLSCIEPPAIIWQNTIGGTSGDLPTTIFQTLDGGYIFGGTSYSDISGDKTEGFFGGGYGGDYWIIKTDNSGIIEWQNTIGGTSGDWLTSIEQTADGGYILGGSSGSNISPDKSENHIGGIDDFGENYVDYWVIKLNASGIVEWENTIGGTKNDYLRIIQQTADGYIVGGYSYSGISGDKTEASIGVTDYWLIKLNNEGLIVWQNTIGGSSYETLQSIDQTADGGFIIGGSSQSGISGDKTIASWGLNDYWILKLDMFGVIEWQKVIGGSSSDHLVDVRQTPDGGYIVAGFSSSGVSGDKTEDHFGDIFDLEQSYVDYWIVKISSSGIIEWQKTIGGDLDDYLTSCKITNDGGYILAGESQSGVSGYKSEENLGYNDIWIVKLNAEGNIEWQKSIKASEYEYAVLINQADDAGYIVLSASNSSISGDKTEACIGGVDFWLIKLGCTPYLEICNTLDDNCNGLIDDDINYIINISAAGPTTFCQGSSVILNATTSGPNYQWKKNGVNIPGAILSSYTVTTKGTYNCETSSACDIALSAGIFVNVQKNPTSSVSAAGPTTFCIGGSVTLNVTPVAGCSYQWYKDASPIPGATATNYLATTAGIYKCRVTKTATGCFKTSAGITVSVPCKEGEAIANNNSVNIQPNPNNGTFTIYAHSIPPRLSTDEVGEKGHSIQLEIYNTTGQQIFTRELNPEQNVFAISMPEIATGMYIVKIIFGEYQAQQKLIIE